jgi:hypothetical protein
MPPSGLCGCSFGSTAESFQSAAPAPASVWFALRGLSEESPDTGSGRGIVRESSYLRAKFAYTAWFVITFRSLVKMASNRSFA